MISWPMPSPGNTAIWNCSVGLMVVGGAFAAIADVIDFGPKISLGTWKCLLCQCFNIDPISLDYEWIENVMNIEQH